MSLYKRLEEALDIADQRLADAIVAASGRPIDDEMWREVRARLHGHQDGIPGRMAEAKSKLPRTEWNILRIIADYQKGKKRHRGMPSGMAEGAYEVRILDKLHDRGLLDYMDWGGETFYRVNPDGYTALGRKVPKHFATAKWPPSRVTEAAPPSGAGCEKCRHAGRGQVAATTMRKGAWGKWSYLCQTCADPISARMDDTQKQKNSARGAPLIREDRGSFFKPEWPATAEEDKAFVILWADGRAICAFRHKKDAQAFVAKQGTGDVVWVHYVSPVRKMGKRSRRKLTRLRVHNSYSPKQEATLDAVNLFARAAGDPRQTSFRDVGAVMNPSPETRDALAEFLPEEREADADGNMTCGVFLPIPYNLARVFPDKSEHDDSIPHYTLLFAGNLSPADYGKLVETVQRVAKGYEPFTLTMAHYSEFKNNDGLTIPHMGALQDLGGLHADLRMAAEAADISIEHSYGPEENKNSYANQFKTHATLAYVTAEDLPYTGPQPTGSWKVTELEIWGHEKFRALLGKTQIDQPTGERSMPVSGLEHAMEALELDEWKWGEMDSPSDYVESAIAEATDFLPDTAKAWLDKNIVGILKKRLGLIMKLSPGHSSYASKVSYSAYLQPTGATKLAYGSLYILSVERFGPKRWAVTFYPKGEPNYHLAVSKAGSTVAAALKTLKMKIKSELEAGYQGTLSKGDHIKGVFLGQEFTGRVSPLSGAYGLFIDFDKPLRGTGGASDMRDGAMFDRYKVGGAYNYGTKKKGKWRTTILDKLSEDESLFDRVIVEAAKVLSGGAKAQAVTQKKVLKTAYKLTGQKLKVKNANVSHKGFDFEFAGGGRFKVRPRSDGSITAKLQGRPKPHYRYRGDGPTLDQALASMKPEKGKGKYGATATAVAAITKPTSSMVKPKKAKPKKPPGPASEKVNGVLLFNDMGVDQVVWDRYARALKDSADLVRKRGFGFMLKNFVMHLRKGTGGAYGNYDMRKKIIEIFVPVLGYKASNTSIMLTMVHEIGHHYYYREIPRPKRKQYRWYFDRAKATGGDFATDYAATKRYEDFAEIFAGFVGRGHQFASKKQYVLTPDIMTRFREFLAFDKRINLKEGESPGLQLQRRQLWTLNEGMFCPCCEWTLDDVTEVGHKK